jgi:predicted acetyltransferase
MKLVKPSLEWKEKHENYMEEWGLDRMVPSSMDLSGFHTYEEFLVVLEDRVKGKEPWVPSSHYFLVDNVNQIMGMIDIRHELNEYLRTIGGHIGYGVRPSERNKGYASYLLKETLTKCKELQISQVLITCDEDNIGSTKVILNNGGIEDDVFITEEGQMKRRFWITLQ